MNKTKNRIVALLVPMIAFLVCTACGDAKRGRSGEDGNDVHGGIASSGGGLRAVGNKPQSRGLPYELAMLIPRGLYKGELKDSLDAVLQGSTPVLPQHEAMFRVDVVYMDANLTPWRTMRSRLLVEVDRSLKTVQLHVARDVVARPQIEVLLKGPSAHEIALFLGLRHQQLTDLFVEHELAVEAANLHRKHDAMTRDSLLALCGRRVCVPASFRASKVGRDFLWTGTNLNDKDQNFIYYSYAWDGRPLSPEGFAAKHDSVLQVNVPGARQGQWMQTARAKVIDEAGAADGGSAGNPGGTGYSGKSGYSGGAGDRNGAGSGHPLISSRTRTINNKVVQEVHGLWELRAGALGGPFVALERIDTAARRVEVCEGFVYSPHTAKRDLLRQMEAALRTFE